MSHAIGSAVRAPNPVRGCWAGDSCGPPRAAYRRAMATSVMLSTVGLRWP